MTKVGNQTQPKYNNNLYYYNKQWRRYINFDQHPRKKTPLIALSVYCLVLDTGKSAIYLQMLICSNKIHHPVRHMAAIKSNTIDRLRVRSPRQAHNCICNEGVSQTQIWSSPPLLKHNFLRHSRRCLTTLPIHCRPSAIYCNVDIDAVSYTVLVLAYVVHVHIISIDTKSFSSLSALVLSI
jgi:hypothetical protein